MERIEHRTILFDSRLPQPFALDVVQTLNGKKVLEVTEAFDELEDLACRFQDVTELMALNAEMAEDEENA